MANTIDYWIERAEYMNAMEDKDLLEFLQLLEESYIAAEKQIKTDVIMMYTKMAERNGFTMAEMIKNMNNKELKEFKWSLKEFKDAAIAAKADQSWIKALINASDRIHVSFAEMLLIQVQQQIELLAAKRLQATTDGASKVYKHMYYRNIYEIQKGIGKTFEFANLDKEAIEKVIKKPWAPDGQNFSARIWSDRTKLVSNLGNIMKRDIINGTNIENMVKDLTDVMQTNKRDAYRLIRTESSYFAGKARLDGYEEGKAKEYEYLSVMDSKTSTICIDMDNKVFKTSQAQVGVNYPPLHVNCRSTTAPVSNWSDVLDDEDNENIPSDMSYAKWGEKYVGEDYNKYESMTPPESVVPSKVKQS